MAILPSILLRLLGNKNMPRLQTKPIAEMSYSDIAEYMVKIDGATAAHYGGSLTHRLYEIAMIDNHIPHAHREGALQFLQIIKGTMEKYFADSPEALKNYREANAEMEGGAKKFGFGSLAWLLVENANQSDEQFEDFVTRPEHAHLLDDFYCCVSPEVADIVKVIVNEKKEDLYIASKKIADPEFLANFLTAQLLLRINFNISESRFNQICERVSLSVRDCMPIWSFFYLSWLMKFTVRNRYGEKFEADMMRSAYGLLMNAPSDVADVTTQMARNLRFWYDTFDSEFENLKKHGPQKIGEHEVPFELGIAMRLLALDEGSPYFADKERANSNGGSIVQDSLHGMFNDDEYVNVADALIEMKNAAIDFIKGAVEIGKPLD